VASLIYNSCLEDALTGVIDFAGDDFACLLVDASYAPDKDLHTTLADVTGEVVGAGYTAGGQAAVVSVAKDLGLDRIDVSLGAVAWTGSTITAAGAVYYQSTGGALVAYIDFGGNIVSTNGTFSLSASTLRIQN
jgi:hypothetical protein